MIQIFMVELIIFFNIQVFLLFRFSNNWFDRICRILKAYHMKRRAQNESKRVIQFFNFHYSWTANMIYLKNSYKTPTEFWSSTTDTVEKMKPKKEFNLLKVWIKVSFFLCFFPNWIFIMSKWSQITILNVNFVSKRQLCNFLSSSTSFLI